MTDGDWHAGYARALGVFLNGEGIPERDPLGERIVDDSFLLRSTPPPAVPSNLPGEAYGWAWEVVVDTADPLRARAVRRQRDAVAVVAPIAGARCWLRKRY